MKFLLDTNVISEAIKTEPNKYVLNMMERHQNEITTAAPIWHELKYRCLRLPKSRKREIIETFINDVLLPNIPILSYDQRASDWHAIERERLTSLGKTPSFVDGQIASITAVHGLILVTRNVKDYKDDERLKIINWYESSK